FQLICLRLAMPRQFALALAVGLASCCLLADIAFADGQKKEVKELRIGVKKRVPAEECTARAAKGDTVSMHYTGTLYSDGSKFDSSLDRNQPFKFTLGVGQVIKGWDQGLIGMCKGEKRRLVIPAHLGYGESGSPPKIPGNSALVFEVELLDIERKDSEMFSSKMPGEL
uniref:peptidylprolyl isomerase n=2 Tax=Macrostomum lignano TaxID=282301 RepID=A0A1I8I794_9PLAT